MKKICFLLVTMFVLFLFNNNVNAAEYHDISAYNFVNSINAGINIGNSLDANESGRENRYDSVQVDQELFYGNPRVTQELLNFIKECGFDTVKIPVTWYYNSYISDDGQLIIYDEWLARVKEVVDYAINANLNVIISSQHDNKMFYVGVENENEINEVYKNAEMLWKQIAEYFKGYDEHLLFDAYNELQNIKKEWSYDELASTQMNKLNQIFVDTVRSTGGNNSKRLLIVPTLTNQYGEDFLSGFVLPSDSVPNRLIIEIHCYSYLYDQQIDKLFKNVDEFYKRTCAPLIIGEFGTKSEEFKPSSFRTKAASNFTARAKSHGLKTIWWDNGSTYKIIDRENFQNSNFDIIDSIVSPTAYKAEYQIYNTNANFVFGQLSSSKGIIYTETEWYGIVLDDNGAPLPIPSGSDYLNLFYFALNDASEIKLKNIAYYDKDENFIRKDKIEWYISPSYPGISPQLIEIPEGASYYRVDFYKSNNAVTTKEEFQKFLDNNELGFSISFVDEGDINSLIVDDTVHADNVNLPAVCIKDIIDEAEEQEEVFKSETLIENPNTGKNIIILFVIFILITFLIFHISGKNKFGRI